VRIAQLCPFDIYRIGGVQRHILDTAAALRDLGHEVTILAPHVHDTDVTRQRGARFGSDHKGIEYVGRGWRFRTANTPVELSGAFGPERSRLKEIASRGGFDVIHYHSVYTPVLGMQALKFSRSANVATLHDTPLDTVSGAVERSYLRRSTHRLLPQLDAVITVSPISTPHYDLRRARRAYVVPPCVDLRRFMTVTRTIPEFRDNRLNILFVGRLEKRKGAAVLIQAYARLCAAGAKARLLIVGEGEERAELEQFCAKNSVPNVIFAGPDRDTPRWYASCDIFCAPTIYNEAFGIVIAEAMASGKPVVATGNPAYRSILGGEAECGLVPPGDVDALYRTLRRFAESAPLRRRLGAWGRTQALRYDTRAVVHDLVAVYSDCETQNHLRLGHPCLQMHSGGSRLRRVMLHGYGTWNGPGQSNGFKPLPGIVERSLFMGIFLSFFAPLFLSSVFLFSIRSSLSRLAGTLRFVCRAVQGRPE